jgi:hypothetical protein
MSNRFTRILLVGAAAVLLHVGPVAACVCTDAPAPSMPCCPDEPEGKGHGDHGYPATEGYSACELVAVDVAGASKQELPAPICIASAPSPLWVHGPPVVRQATQQAPYESPPIYLVTLRLRN